MARLLLFAFLLPLSTIAHATDLETFVAKRQGFKFEKPQGWLEANNYWGSEFIVLSPIRESKLRSSIQINGLQMTAKELKLDEKPDLKQFLEHDEKWAEKNGAEIISYQKVEKIDLKNDRYAQKTGARYEIYGKVYRETNYFVACKDRDQQVYHLTVKIPEENYAQDRDIGDTAIDSFSCDASTEPKR